MISDLDYALPQELIAQHPTAERDAARLLVVEGDGILADRTINDLPSLLPPSLFVFNNTRVFPARLRTVRQSGGAVEFLLVRKLSGDDQQSEWLAMARPAKRLLSGEKFIWPGELELEIVSRAPEADFLNVRVSALANQGIAEALERIGQIPLPPYIERAAAEADRERYQTTFAKEWGAVAAPTAGLHFSERLLETLRDAGHQSAELTLHVGPGTFRPIQTDHLEAHQMHEEEFLISDTCAAAIAKARSEGTPVVAVGTTVVRALESAAIDERQVRPGSGITDIFIRPPYQFRVVDHLVTNFHLPRSTLLALVMAFAGTETIKRAYAHAVAARYRFYSYGDAMLLKGSQT